MDTDEGAAVNAPGVRAAAASGDSGAATSWAAAIGGLGAAVTVVVARGAAPPARGAAAPVRAAMPCVGLDASGTTILVTPGGGLFVFVVLVETAFGAAAGIAVVEVTGIEETATFNVGGAAAGVEVA